ncbi:hypothetical protein [Cohnella abietis]|uniref:CD-NTase associated protein 4-like DNA endonuclease domain-containing protein n=1 Tax=Cohnella abietis TaxID=2507935 RepID=A0A3T1DA57_9BACL|nr:hypothetical protein [Cohnella abietis]BBI34949.1 hypothetical protein KCTCHS21_43480 [Cohnella abietis]
MERSIISRVVGEQSKGERLQRLRAIQLIFDELEKAPNISVLVACEYIEDVYLNTSDGDGKSSEYLESDKSYESKCFSLNSDEVKNSLVSFLDVFLHYGHHIRFGFYTNTGITNERTTELLKQNKLELPDKELMLLLMNKEYVTVLPYLKCILLEDYRKQYVGKNATGYLHVIEKYSDDLWIQFLEQINWKFEEEDENELELTLLLKVKNCRLYDTVSVSGKEQYIIDALDKELEKRQAHKDPLHRLINTDTIRTKFLEIGNNVATSKPLDPCYEDWDSMEKPFDGRDINSKIKDVSPDYDDTTFEVFARKIGSIKTQLRRVQHQARGAYLYRVFEACEEQLIRIVHKQTQKSTVEPSVVDDWIEMLVRSAIAHIEDWGKDYNYPFRSENAVRDTIYELINSCYLAFDRRN